jgi:hypothetical protein
MDSNPLESTCLDVPGRVVSVPVGSDRGGARTLDQRINVPKPDRRNPVHGNELKAGSGPVATHLPLDPTPMPADLSLIIESWEQLPEAVRAGIVAMVRASGPTGTSRK